MSEIYYIDGYNLLHYVPQWKDLAEHDLEGARDALVVAVSKWCAATSHTAKIVFDGAGRRTEATDHMGASGGVEVLYTSRQKTADSIIERGVYEAQHRASIIVVSADRGILDLCLGMGALSMKPDNFVATMNEAASGLSEKIAGAQFRGSLGTVEDALNEEEKAELDRLRGRLKD